MDKNTEKEIQAPQKRKIRLKDLVYLQAVVIVYTLSGVAAKGASRFSFLSWEFIGFYSLEIFILAIYAFFWQRILKIFDLSLAYANRAIAILWSMVWAVLLLGETVTYKNIIGVLIVIIGTFIVNTDD